MAKRIKDERKTYAMSRMIAAIGRAINAVTHAEKDRAARWAAAWGPIGGIRTPAMNGGGLRLRRTVLIGDRRSRPR